MDTSILVVLAMKPGSDKREIGRYLGEFGFTSPGTSAINSNLYALLKRGMVRKVGDSPPRWSLAEVLQDGLRTTDRSQPAVARRESIRKFERSGRLLRTWQEEALAAWESAGRVGVVEAVTGTGKTQVGIEAIHGQLLEAGRALVVVPTKALLHQWDRELVRTFGKGRVGRRGDGFADSLSDFEIVVSAIHSADGAGQQGSGVLLVADECHRYGAPTWFASLSEGFVARLGLTATFSRDDDGDELLEAYFGGDPIYQIGYERAIKDGVVAPFRLAFIGVALSYEERSQYDEYDRRCRRARRELISYGLSDEPFAVFMQQTNVAASGNWSAEATKPARSYLSAFAKRRALMAECPAKLDMLASLDAAVASANGTLIFTQTKSAAESAAESLAALGHRSAAIYGDLDGDERERLLEAFRSGERTVLSAPRVLDEGIDVPEADLGIIVSASKSKRQMIQRMGRTLRLKTDGRSARMVVIYAEGTSEDPSVGAHEGFMKMAWDVAMAKRIFGAADSRDEILKFLRADATTVAAALPQVTIDGFAPRPQRASARSKRPTKQRRGNTCSLCHLALRWDGRCEFHG